MTATATEKRAMIRASPMACKEARSLAEMLDQPEIPIGRQNMLKKVTHKAA